MARPAVDQATDVAVELDVGQVEFAGFDFSGVFFVEVAVGDDLGVAEQRVAVEVELCVQRLDVAVAFEDQRVDLGEGRVRVHVHLVQLLEHVDGLGLRGCRHADAVGELEALRVGQARGRFDEHLDDLLGRGMGHFLDVHAALAAGHDGDLLRGAIGHGRDVIFFLDVGAFFDQQATHFLAFRAGLVGLELHAEDFSRQLLDFIDRAGELDAAALATATGVDLGLHHPHRTAELLRGIKGFLHAECGITAGHRYTGLAQDFLALVFMDFHR